MTSRPAGVRSGRRLSASDSDAQFQNILGASTRMQRIFRLVQKVAPTDSTVLLIGESGTGKELIARSIHLHSRRAQGPFVPVNVGALPESLIESELFGAMRGAFTGAAADRPGLIESADGGTLFLDEIGDMPLATQVKLLRTLESNEVRRLGEQTPRLVDIRVIAATHRDLRRAVAEGRFREDLYFRLNVVQIDLPPLRQRREDIGLLASYFLERSAARAGRGPFRFSNEVTQLLERYEYPGNVRELENAIEHAVAVAEGSVIQAADLPASIREPRLLSAELSTRDGRAVLASEGTSREGTWPRDESGGAAPASSRRDRDPGGARPLPSRVGSTEGEVDGRDSDRSTWSLADIEKEHIQRVLALHRGNATTAARQLGISRTTLWRKLREYGLKRTGG
jgi:two-component system, NtrC family, response regulator AtoC